MGKVPAASLARLAKLADQLAKSKGTQPLFREGFGTGSLFVGRKMFAVLDESGALVLKLPAARVAELVGAGVGAPWHPGTGTPLKEYVAIGVERQAKWLALAKESHSYMASKK
jgi:hypothetical protein